MSWEYELDDGVSFSYVQVRWIEKPANDAPINWGNATKHLIWNANASSYQITGLTSGTEYAVRLFIGLRQNGAFKLLKTDAGTFTAPASGSSLSLSASSVSTALRAKAASVGRDSATTQRTA